MKAFKSLCVGLVVILGACQNEKVQTTIVESPIFYEPDPPVWTFNDDEVELGTTDFETFDIEPDYSKLEEKLWIDPNKKMYVENINFKNHVEIYYRGEKVIVKAGNSDFYVNTDGAHVTVNSDKSLVCDLYGKSEDGSLNILGDCKVRVNLNGLNLKNTKGPAIGCQSKKICFIVTDSASVLADGSVYEYPNKDVCMNGCVCSKGYIAFSGKARLKIFANGADAIHSGKTVFIRRGTDIDINSSAKSAIKAKNRVDIEGGVINIISTGHGGHGIAAKKEVNIAGGRTTIISNTGIGINGKNSRGIKSDSLVAIKGGIVRVKDSSVGGKGIRAGKKFIAKNCIVDVLTFGQDDKTTGSKNRGIKGEEEIRIDSARVRVRTENGWNEGLSTRRKVCINNSLVELKTRDDCISAGQPKLADVEINNARVYAHSGMDAIDSNGTVHINGGVVFAIAQSHLCRGVDCDVYEFKIAPEATVVTVGQITSKPTTRLLEQPVCFVERPITDKFFCLSSTGTDNNLISFDTPKLRFSNSGYRVLVSTPGMIRNNTFDFCNKAMVKPKHTFHGLAIGGTARDKNITAQHKLTEMYNVLDMTNTGN